MDLEQLIERVRSYEPLYVVSHPKYSDNEHKTMAWTEIGKHLKRPGSECKRSWLNLRDCFRRAIQKKRNTKSGQANKKISKWKFEDEMSFLIPHFQERERLTSVELGVDTEDDSENEDENAENVEPLTTYEQIGNKSNPVAIPKNKKSSKRREAQETASSIVMKYLLQNKENTTKEPKQPQRHDSVDSFFSSISETVKAFSPYYQNIAKCQVLNIVMELEMQQILQQSSTPPPRANPPMQRSSFVNPSNYTAVLAPSPSNNTNPILSPSPGTSSSTAPVSPMYSNDTFYRV